MQVSYDPVKNDRNIRERGLSFDRAAELDFASALIWEDVRKQYGEIRYIALSHLDGRLHVLCFTETADGIRVISFRKDNAKEVKIYDTQKTID
jgi:uncharacterized protein